MQNKGGWLYLGAFAEQVTNRLKENRDTFNARAVEDIERAPLDERAADVRRKQRADRRPGRVSSDH